MTLTRSCRLVILGVFLLGLSWGAASGPSAHAQEDEWSTPVNLSQSPNIVSRYPDLTVDATGRVHAVWVEPLVLEQIASPGNAYRNYAGSEGTIQYATWQDGSWSAPVDIVYEQQSIILPSIAVDSYGAVHLVYWYGGSLLYIHSLPGGRASSARDWSRPINLSERFYTYPNRFPNLVVDSAGILHLIFTGRAQDLLGDSQGTQVWYSRSDDGGQSWMAPVLVSTHSDNLFASRSYDANFAVDAHSGLHLVTVEDDTIVYTRSLDGGRTWSKGLPVSADPGQAYRAGYVSAVGDEVHLFWGDIKRGLYHRWSSDEGTTWSGAAQLSAEGPTFYGGIATASDGLGRLLVVYPYEDDLWSRIWNGETWSEPTNVSRDLGKLSFWPRVVISGGNIAHLVWYTGFAELALYDALDRMSRGEYEIHYAQRRLEAPALASASYQATETAGVVPTETPSPKITSTTVLSTATAPTRSATPYEAGPPPTLAIDPQRSVLVGVLVGVGAALALVVVIGVVAVRRR